VILKTYSLEDSMHL